ncbi:MAG: hypothetical protein NVV62_04985 [Terricaulis sp.]|nr:hypothetical protein [Terricaulis sp.]
MAVHRGAKCVKRRSIGNLLMLGVSAFAFGALSTPNAAFAQSDEASDDDIVVTGIRSSLRSSQEIKRDADVFVDLDHLRGHRRAAGSLRQ